MKKTVLTILLVLAALAAGVGGAYGASSLLRGSLPAQTGNLNNPGVYGNYGQQLPYGRGPMMGGPGYDEQLPNGHGPMMGGRGYDQQLPYGRGPMMGGRGYNQPQTGTRITQDEAVQQARAYLARLDANLSLSEVMEFENNFYLVAVEKDGGHAAMELLVDAYTGQVMPEHGPNMMWNQKYGHMGGGQVDSTVSMDDARAAAQTYLDANLPGAQVETDGGLAFYGYYTFDYTQNGKIAGMLSVNGLDSTVWLHTWHGAFINEKEISQ